MRFVITYDNEALSGFKKDWGFACLIDEHVLFDTGADYRRLLFNMQRLKVDLSAIDSIVLSHAHGDHTGGLQIVERLGAVRVFVPSSFFQPVKKELSGYEHVEVVEVRAMTKIAEGITSTGEISKMEQSLIVQADRGLVVVTGCSHPGLDIILNTARDLGTIYAAVGGFHGFDRLELLGDLELIIPCHCTKQKKQILADYPETSKECAAGCVFDI